MSELNRYINNWQQPVQWFNGWERTLVNKARDVSNMWVYFIEAENSNAIKIGKTGTPDLRFASLDTINADNLSKRFLFNYSLIAEEDLHNEFKSLNYKGEWFNYSSELKSFIKHLTNQT